MSQCSSNDVASPHPAPRRASATLRRGNVSHELMLKVEALAQTHQVDAEYPSTRYLTPLPQPGA